MGETNGGRKYEKIFAEVLRMITEYLLRFIVETTKLFLMYKINLTTHLQFDV